MPGEVDAIPSDLSRTLPGSMAGPLGEGDGPRSSGPVSIGILGTPVSCGNRGVMALGASLVNLCSLASGGGRVALLFGNRDGQGAWMRIGGEPRLVPVVHSRMSLRTHPRHHFLWILGMSLTYRLVHWRRLRKLIAGATPWIRVVEEADLVGDIRGGDSFSDLYGMRRFVTGFLTAWTVVLIKGSIVQFPQTYGPYESRIARCLARYLLRRSSVVVARDRQSRKVAQDLLGPAREVLLSPDVAFCLEAVRPPQVETVPELAGPIPPATIGLNVNGLMFHGGYNRNNMFRLTLEYPVFLRSLAIRLLQESTADLLLIPHTFAAAGNVESDNQACVELRAGLPLEFQSRVRVVVREYDQHEIKGVIGMVDFMIGSRMHACIAALSQGVPCVGVAYSRKFLGVFESVGMADWVVDGREVGNEEAISRILELYRRREAVRGPLAIEAARTRSELAAVFGRILSQTIRSD